MAMEVEKSTTMAIAMGRGTRGHVPHPKSGKMKNFEVKTRNLDYIILEKMVIFG